MIGPKCVLRHVVPEVLSSISSDFAMYISTPQGRTRDNTKEVESFRDQLNSRSVEYVEEILSPHFGSLMQVVKEGEIFKQKGDTDKLKSMEGERLEIAGKFSLDTG